MRGPDLRGCPRGGRRVHGDGGRDGAVRRGRSPPLDVPRRHGRPRAGGVCRHRRGRRGGPPRRRGADVAHLPRRLSSLVPRRPAGIRAPEPQRPVARGRPSVPLPAVRLQDVPESLLHRHRAERGAPRHRRQSHVGSKPSRRVYDGEHGHGVVERGRAHLGHRLARGRPHEDLLLARKRVRRQQPPTGRVLPVRPADDVRGEGGRRRAMGERRRRRNRSEHAPPVPRVHGALLRRARPRRARARPALGAGQGGGAKGGRGAGPASKRRRRGRVEPYQRRRRRRPRHGAALADARGEPRGRRVRP
mmetsp:Transcript_7071/g.32316  ORF Transcript_7071/g.32316 Transcript_7071/m.32316 type:complete len:304 (+) Transcript_7071:48-959(+)